MEGGYRADALCGKAEKRGMKSEAMLIALALLFLLSCWMDWIDMKEDARDMIRDEKDEQGENDSTGAAAEDKR